MPSQLNLDIFSVKKKTHTRFHMIINVHCGFGVIFFSSPEDGDIDANTGRVILLQPGTQVEEARE